MKKIMMAVCAVAVLSLTGCKKDKVEPDNPSGPQYPTGEGIYIPSHKIASLEVDGLTTETWTWDDWKLVSIVNESDNGTLNSFGYNEYRLASASTTIYGLPVSFNYVYTGDKLSSITAGEMATINVIHGTNDKISRLTIEIDNQLLNMLLNMLLGMLNNGDDGDMVAANPLVSLLGRPVLEEMAHLCADQVKGQKITIGSTEFTVDLAWQGDNVSQMYVSAQISGTATLGEIRSIINLDSLAGSFASILSALDDDTEIPLAIDLRDTSVFAYDANHNPYCGFYGRLDPSVFSAANVTSATNSGSATITATLTVPVLGNLPIPYTYPIEAGTTNVSYTYNNDGYPLTATDDEGATTYFNYK